MKSFFPSQALDIRKCVIGVPENGEVNEVSLIIALAFCLEALSETEIREQETEQSRDQRWSKEGSPGRAGDLTSGDLGNGVVLGLFSRE